MLDSVRSPPEPRCMSVREYPCHAVHTHYARIRVQSCQCTPTPVLTVCDPARPQEFREHVRIDDVLLQNREQPHCVDPNPDRRIASRNSVLPCPTLLTSRHPEQAARRVCGRLGKLGIVCSAMCSDGRVLTRASGSCCLTFIASWTWCSGVIIQCASRPVRTLRSPPAFRESVGGLYLAQAPLVWRRSRGVPSQSR